MGFKTDKILINDVEVAAKPESGWANEDIAEGAVTRSTIDIRENMPPVTATPGYFNIYAGSNQSLPAIVIKHNVPGTFITSNIQILGGVSQSPLSVVVNMMASPRTVRIQLETDENGAVLTTAGELATAINNLGVSFTAGYVMEYNDVFQDYTIDTIVEEITLFTAGETGTVGKAGDKIFAGGQEWTCTYAIPYYRWVKTLPNEDGSVTENIIADGAVSADKLSDSALTFGPRFTLRKLSAPPSNGAYASVITTQTGEYDNELLITAIPIGEIGNNYSFRYAPIVDDEENPIINQQLAVEVIPLAGPLSPMRQISVTLATDFMGIVTSTANDVANAVNGHEEASLLVSAIPVGNGTQTIGDANIEYALEGGVDATPGVPYELVIALDNNLMSDVIYINGGSQGPGWHAFLHRNVS